MATYGSALTAGHFWQTPGMPAQPKVTKRSLPHHSAPRPGSVCPHSGLNPWAAATGHPWPTRLTRRPAGLPTDSSLRSASVVDGACQIKVKSKIKSRARRPESRPEWLKQKQGNSTATHFYLMHRDPNVGAGLLAKAVCQLHMS